MLDLAIVGGGPGGLMSAWYLKKKLGELCRVTIYEASDRLGGKIVTRKFDSAPAMYEAGVAEIYDPGISGAVSTSAAAAGFVVSRLTIELQGLCPRCRDDSIVQ